MKKGKKSKPTFLCSNQQKSLKELKQLVYISHLVLLSWLLYSLRSFPFGTGFPHTTKTSFPLRAYRQRSEAPGGEPSRSTPQKAAPGAAPGCARDHQEPRGEASREERSGPAPPRPHLLQVLVDGDVRHAAAALLTARPPSWRRPARHFRQSLRHFLHGAQRSQSRPLPPPSRRGHVVSRRASFPPPAARGGRGLAPAAKGGARGAGPGRDHVRRGARRVSRRGGGARGGWLCRSALRRLRWLHPTPPLLLLNTQRPKAPLLNRPPPASRPLLHPHKGGLPWRGAPGSHFVRGAAPAHTAQRPGRRPDGGRGAAGGRRALAGDRWGRGGG